LYIADVVTLTEELGGTDMNRILTFTLSALMLSAPALAQTAPEQRKMYLEKPIGDGDPSAISCYPSPSSISRVRKLDCKSNSEWASIYAAEKSATRIDTGRIAPAPMTIVH
jgi:hypothetical protein